VMKIRIEEILPSDADVKQLFKLLDEHNLSHCPPEVCNLLQPEEMIQIESLLLGVFCDGVLSGMGGLKYFKEYAEVTRMYVKEEYRGNGLATQLLNVLESKALERGITNLKLETSDNFDMAVRLYLKHGFKKCKPFGEYVKKPYNTYMELDIT
jgi:putative acetyltransferase